MIIVAHNGSSLPLDGGDKLLLGAPLTGNQTMMSKNGTFALGVFSPRRTNNWYIGIWYARNSQNFQAMPILEFSLCWLTHTTILRLFGRVSRIRQTNVTFIFMSNVL
ncbi:hypothetical protein SUGI_1090200 [Cryptomeria japonica]|nr:hypothetical protein SUGI_1090200 [Cryptomeria japonica]